MAMVVAGMLGAGPVAVAAEPPAPEADIVFARLMGDPQNYEIWTMDRSGAHQRRLTFNAVADHDPTWSPDGRRIVWVRYESQYSSGPADLWVMNADGSEKRRLTRWSTVVGSPTWSPDGSRIAFERENRIWVMDADGTDMHPISPEGAFDFDPDWSPTGEWIAFSSSGPRTFDLFAMRTDGSERHLLAATNGTSDSDATWSPDGRRIAYSANRSSGGWHVASMRADGTGHHLVVDDYSLGPAWTPSGTGLVFYACSDVGCGLHTSTFRGADVTALGFRGSSDVQPDHRS